MENKRIKLSNFSTAELCRIAAELRAVSAGKAETDRAFARAMTIRDVGFTIAAAMLVAAGIMLRGAL